MSCTHPDTETVARRPGQLGLEGDVAGTELQLIKAAPKASDLSSASELCRDRITPKPGPARRSPFLKQHFTRGGRG